jgi:hypothetical protein
MKYSVTRLRQNLYRILDEVLEKGIPVEIDRKGQILKIVPRKPIHKLDNLEPHQVVSGDPQSLLKINWANVWKQGENL